MAWASGPREAPLAEAVVRQTRQRTKGRAGVAYGSDGGKPSAETIALTYCDREPSGIHPAWDILRPTEGIRLSQAVTHRHGRRLERGEVRALTGEPGDPPYPVHRERLSGMRRARLGCLTRKPHAFAKDVATADALFSLALFEHHWLVRTGRSAGCCPNWSRVGAGSRPPRRAFSKSSDGAQES